MGHATVEWVYVGVVISLLTWVGAESWNVERIIEHVPTNAETIKVVGQQWFWTFEHQDGTKEVGQLHVKQGVPYKFELVSKDVVHDFNVPDFVVLMDAVPGRVNVVWNMFDKPGEFLIQCREYCGFGHADMRAKLFVEPFTQPAEAGAGQTAPPAAGNATTNQTSATTPPPAGNATTNQTSATTPPPSGPAGTPLTILQGASIQGSPDYDPDSLTVKKGDKITVTNKDTLPHTVTSGTGLQDPNSAKLFDTSIMEAGATADIATTNVDAGNHPYYCIVHPYMTGTLIIQ
jgi:cytochrome c oxidase subunit 2